jgi:hypothetical protein
VFPAPSQNIIINTGTMGYYIPAPYLVTIISNKWFRKRKWLSNSVNYTDFAEVITNFDVVIG